MKTGICFLLLLAFPVLSTERIQAQQPYPVEIDFDRFQGIHSEDPLPALFFSSTTERSRSEQAGVNSSELKAKKLIHSERQRLQSTFFEVDRFMTSGRVVYNDVISKYMNEVLRFVLVGEEFIPDEVQVYVLKSTVVNAYTTRQGYILVSLGLLARLQNEAQLAALLCHEYIHFRNKHSHQTIRHQVKTDVNKKKYDSEKVMKRVRVERMRFSRTLETEADQQGWEIFFRTAYDPRAVMDLFLILQRAEEPVDSLIPEKSWIERKDVVLPETRWIIPKFQEAEGHHKGKKEPARTRTAEEVEDTESEDDESEDTHPDLEQRMSMIRQWIDSLRPEGGETFVVNREKFELAQKLARYELAMLYLEERRVERAFYHACATAAAFGEGYYLTMVQVRSLYFLASASNYHRFSKFHRYPSRVQGMDRMISSAFHEMSREELTLLALKHAWDAWKKYPDSEELEALVQDLMRQLVEKCKFSLDKFEEGPMPVPEHLSEEEEPLARSPNKTGKYMRHAFQEEMQDSGFMQTFRKFYDAHAQKQEAEPRLLSRKSKSSKFGVKVREMPSHVTVMSPQVMEIYVNRKDEYMEWYERSETSVRDLEALLSANLSKMPFPTSLWHASLGEKWDAEKLNKSTLAVRFIEQVQFAEKYDLSMIPLHRFDMKKISEDNTRVDYIARVRMLRAKIQPAGPSAMDVLILIYFPVVAPYLIYRWLTPRNRCVYSIQVVDVQNGEIAFEATARRKRRVSLKKAEKWTRKYLKQLQPQAR